MVLQHLCISAIKEFDVSGNGILFCKKKVNISLQVLECIYKQLQVLTMQWILQKWVLVLSAYTSQQITQSNYYTVNHKKHDFSD